MDSNDNQILLTQEGFEKIKLEHEERVNTIRNRIATEIELAREQGDLSENAAYHAAIKDKEFNEARIRELEGMLKYAVVKKSNPRDKKLDIGEKFILESGSVRKEFQLVGGNEADPAIGKISIDSPIGKAVLGRHYNEKVSIELPGGLVEYTIKEVK